MKTLKSLLLVAAAVFALVSCSENDADGHLEDSSFSIIVENPDIKPDTRTYQGKVSETIPTLWFNGDKLLLRTDYGSDMHLLFNNGDDSVKTAVFSGRENILEEVNKCSAFSAIYTDLFVDYEDCSTAVFLFKDETAAFNAGSIMKHDALVSKLVARNQKYAGPIQLSMKRITSIVEFKINDKTSDNRLANDNIIKLNLNSKFEKLSGSLRYDFKTGKSDKWFDKQFTDDNITVYIGNDIILKSGSDPVYFCMIPAEIKQNVPLTVKLFTNAGYEIKKVITNRITFEEGKITTLEIDITDKDIIKEP